MANIWDKRHENVMNGSFKKTKRQIFHLNVKTYFFAKHLYFRKNKHISFHFV
jgi:hypothetical protein